MTSQTDVRMDYLAKIPEASKLLFELEAYFHANFKDSTKVTFITWELLKLRVSQINQCAFCIDMHSKDALAHGELPERIYGLSAWRDWPGFSESERAALTWAEELTACKPISDALYHRTLAVFGEKGLVDLTIAVNAINSWNRMVKAFKPLAGQYQPRKAA